MTQMNNIFHWSCRMYTIVFFSLEKKIKVIIEISWCMRDAPWVVVYTQMERKEMGQNWQGVEEERFCSRWLACGFCHEKAIPVVSTE